MTSISLQNSTLVANESSATWVSRLLGPSAYADLSNAYIAGYKSKKFALSYEIIDDGATGGWFTFDGKTKVSAERLKSLTPADIFSLQYVAGAKAGTERLTIGVKSAIDADFTTASMSVVTADPVRLQTTHATDIFGNRVALAPLLAGAQAPSGKAITQYSFEIQGQGCVFTRDGVSHWGAFTINANQIAGLSLGWLGLGTDKLLVKAYDGTSWSGAASIAIDVSHEFVLNSPPTLGLGQKWSATSLIGATFDNITKYAFSSYNGFYLDGVFVGSTAVVTASQLHNLVYAGSGGASTDTITITATDAAGVAETQTTNVAVRALNIAPTLTAANLLVGPTGGSLISGAALIANAQDYAGRAISHYRFENAGAGGGTLYLNGVAVRANSWVDVTDLSQLTYRAGATRGVTDTISIKAYDGAYWSAVATGGVTVTSVVDQLTDAGVRADVQRLLQNNSLDYASTLLILQDAARDGMTQREFESLQKLDSFLDSASPLSVSTSDYVKYIFDALVDGNDANALWTGGHRTSSALGNLTATSSETQVDALIDKWFLGTDHPYSGWGAYKAASNTPLFANGGPRYTDVNQNSAGDCYLISSLSELALKDPTAIRDMIVDNHNGTCGVRFFQEQNGIAFKEEWVTVDNQLPTLANGSFNYDRGPGLWGELIEKAYAQWIERQNGDGWNKGREGSNSYDGLWAGGADVLTELTGKQVSCVRYTDAAQFQNFANAFNAGQEALVETSITGYGNLVGNHMYSVVGVDVAHQTLTLRNPWGFLGNQSDSLATLSAAGCQLFVTSGSAHL